jgi:hypothetical protein
MVPGGLLLLPISSQPYLRQRENHAQMSDPLEALPYELWVFCIAFVIDGNQAGPLELFGVSTSWDKALLDTPSLWSQIYILNEEDEMARVSTFLYLSKGCSLHVHITTVPLTLGSLQLAAENIARVKAISIWPRTSDINSAAHVEQWKQAASHILARLSNGLIRSDVKDASRFGISLRENGQLYYAIILLKFIMANPVADHDKQNVSISTEISTKPQPHVWEEIIAGQVSVSHCLHT